MKKKNKIIVIVLLTILLPIIILFAPIKNVVKHVDTVDAKKEQLLDGERTEIYVTIEPECTESRWLVKGKDGRYFSGKNYLDSVMIRGNFPSKMNLDLFPDTIFALKGTFKLTEDKGQYGVRGYFNVEDWSVLNSIERKEFKFLSKTSLTLWDYTSEDVIPLN